jgi:hypothetical protein
VVVAGGFSHRCAFSASTAAVCFASSTHRRGSVDLLVDEFTRLDAQLVAERPSGGGRELRALGDWHAHPGGETSPSPPDLEGQALDLATIGSHNASVVSLIVTRRADRESWTRPVISAWVTRHARSSFGERMVCEPAMVRVA